MRRDWRRPIVVMGVAAAVLGFQSMASPQWIQYPTANLPRTPDGRPDLSAPAPRTADGRPDFSGVWENVGYENAVEGLGPPPRTVFFDLSFGMDGPPPYRPWAAELYAHRKEENSKDNPDARCLPIGALQMLVHPLPKKIVQIPGLLLLLHERNMEYRQIFTDGRALPEDPRPAWYGYSSGRWEDDTLVVETIGFNDELWADFNGSPDDGTLHAPELRHAGGRGDGRRPEGLHPAVDRRREPPPHARYRPAGIRVPRERAKRPAPGRQVTLTYGLAASLR
jgi:hypothetical protein